MKPNSTSVFDIFEKDKQHKNRFRRYCRNVRFTRNRELNWFEGRVLRRWFRVWDKFVVGTLAAAYFSLVLGGGCLAILVGCVVAALPIAIAVLLVCLVVCLILSRLVLLLFVFLLRDNCYLWSIFK